MSCHHKWNLDTLLFLSALILILATNNSQVNGTSIVIAKPTLFSARTHTNKPLAEVEVQDQGEQGQRYVYAHSTIEDSVESDSVIAKSNYNSNNNINVKNTIESRESRGVEHPRALGLLTITAILAIPIIILVLILIFLPIPVAISTARMAKEIVTRDECLERMCCEALRFAREIEYDAKWIQKFVRNSRRNSIWIERVSRGMHTDQCGVLSCDPITAFARVIR